MFKNLPDTLLIERSMMHRMETSGAVLQYLPQFLQTLARNKESAPSTEKIDKLKTSPFATYPVVEHSIARAERSLTSKDQLSPAILLHSIIVNLQFAVPQLQLLVMIHFLKGGLKLGSRK